MAHKIFSVRLAPFPSSSCCLFQIFIGKGPNTLSGQQPEQSGSMYDQFIQICHKLSLGYQNAIGTSLFSFLWSQALIVSLFFISMHMNIFNFILDFVFSDLSQVFLCPRTFFQWCIVEFCHSASLQQLLLLLLENYFY